MGKVQVKNELKIYEKDNGKWGEADCPNLIVENHWNDDDFVVLVLGGHRYTVEAGNLKRAIDNATNVGL